MLGEEVDLAPEASRQCRSVDLPRRHSVLEREPDAVNSDLLRISAPGWRAADDFAQFGANRVRSELRASGSAHADGEVSIVADEDGLADHLPADFAFTRLVGTDCRDVRAGS